MRLFISLYSHTFWKREKVARFYFFLIFKIIIITIDEKMCSEYKLIDGLLVLTLPTKLVSTNFHYILEYR